MSLAGMRVLGALQRRTSALTSPAASVAPRLIATASSGEALPASAAGAGRRSRSNALAAPAPIALTRFAHSSSARDAVNMGLKDMAPSNRGEYVVTKLDDCALDSAF